MTIESNIVFQRLLDKWITLTAPTPEDLLTSIVGYLTEKHCVRRIDTAEETPESWTTKTLRTQSIMTHIAKGNHLIGDVRLIDDGDVEDVYTSYIPQYRSAVETRQPVFDSIETKEHGFLIVSDRIIVPDKAHARPRWLFCCLFSHAIIKLPEMPVHFDEMDELIVIYCGLGMTAREVAEEVNLSPRTVEHRLERLKKRAGARTLAELIATSTAQDIAAKVKYEMSLAGLVEESLT